MSDQNHLIIKKLDSYQDMLQAYPLLTEMYDKMDFDTYSAYIAEMIRVNNFRMIGAFYNDKLVGVCGYWVLLMLYCGRYIQISNFMVDEQYRSLGVGRAIINYAENLGRQMGCSKFVLDSYTENKKSHSLYFREGFYIRGLHFMKDIG